MVHLFIIPLQKYGIRLKERKFVVYGMSSLQVIWTINPFRTSPILISDQCLYWANPQCTHSQFLSFSHQCYICCMFFKCLHFCGSWKNITGTFFWCQNWDNTKKNSRTCNTDKKKMVWWLYRWKIRSSGI
jgi:hypothetical protein